MKVHFSHKSDEWETPQELFEELNREFFFEWDVAATQDNSKCKVYIDAETDAMTQDWSKSNWCNPPYSKVREFTAKAAEEAKKGNLTVMLIPARTDTRFFHDHIYKKSNVEVRFLKGRLKFISPDGKLLRGTKMNGSNNSAPFPSMVVVFKKPQ
jgi:site-specific DNA-methyltransferase (adenine-specific)